MSLIDKRLHIIKRNVYFKGTHIKEVNFDNINEYLHTIGNYQVVNAHTLYIGNYLRKEEEKVVWLNIEGLEMGWKHLKYEDAEGNMDFKGLTQEFKEELNHSLNTYKEIEGSQLFYIKDTHPETIYIVMVNGKPLEGKDEVENKIYVLTTQPIHEWLEETNKKL